MSIAGIRSNRGDLYQTMVAFEWALTVLSDKDYEWLEIDSLTYSVDDVVVGKVDGTQIALQCKKNQADFKAWTIADLADELDKASRLLIGNPNTDVRFYSRNNFGALAKLREHSATQPDEISYLKSLGKDHCAVDAALLKQISASAPGLSTYNFLRRTTFVTTDELDRMEAILRERLRNIASNPESAFNALWARLDYLGARIDGNSASVATQHRLTKEDLKVILHRAGAMLVPPLDIAQIRSSFSSTSAIGRSWKRDIAGTRVFSSTVGELLTAISGKKRSILLTGLPGAGKTCVMLALQEALEERAKNHSDVVPLFIQSREFADLVTAEDRQVQGLSEQWVEKAARMAEHTNVIVIIDSLDVLSIAREHLVLTYFLAQIDRLLLVSNITVVTACRDFDRQYDRRIAERQWECELKCQPLDWDAVIVPLLTQLGIGTATVDKVTRELIRNPRELALFVELAQQEGTFNVVTSQALAQRYLNSIVRANESLGDVAIKAIEEIASEMLRLRSLVVPHQRFPASQDIQRGLCSLNVLQETQDGKLTFGHQTLLDVLVISGALRSGATLNHFIQQLPPVPFVRPSIRNFVAQLALGERRDFRKQLRAVLTGSVAFHIKRLVAESFVEQMPQDDDWPLIRDLWANHRDVFQVIYTLAGAIEWHRFWLKHFVPLLKTVQDADGMMMHSHQIAKWINEDSRGVLSFWTEAFSLNWFRSREVGDRLAMYLSEIRPENMDLVVPLVKRLLDMPQAEHSFLGRVIGRCVKAGVMDDTLLWRYISSNLTDDDVTEYKIRNKLRCGAHELGDRNDDFLRERMEHSTSLLNLALEAIERWSGLCTLFYGETTIGYRQGFLNETSYRNIHSKGNLNHIDSLNILLAALEASILYHARSNSEWWRNNRERLCLNHEGALLYFGIKACTIYPETNIDLIGRVLSDRKILMFELNYELGSLLQSSFGLLEVTVQDAVIENILTLWDEEAADESNFLWILKTRAELIVAVPGYMRSLKAQAVVDLYGKKIGILSRQPNINSYGGVVGAPFSYDVFLEVSNKGVLSLLKHYNGDLDWRTRGVDFLIGGEREVGSQLREASSRNPTRFLDLLSTRWEDIPEKFCSDIMEGVATYLAYRYGNLQANNGWIPIEEPDSGILASKILDELERHPQHWQHSPSAAKALEASANVIHDVQNADRLILLTAGFEGFLQADPIIGSNVDLISLGINMVKGDVAEALMILANNFQEHGAVLPESLTSALLCYARSEHPAIRALILRRLPYLQSKVSELGWALFHNAMRDAKGLWQIAERCLYYTYHNNFEVVKPLLERILNEGSGKDLETWGRISALASMAQHVDFSKFLNDLNSLKSLDAWQGAVTVWTNSENFRLYREQCVFGIESSLNAGGACAEMTAGKMDNIFREKINFVIVPIELILAIFSVFKNDEKNKHHRLFEFHDWLNGISQINPEYALTATEIYLDYISHSKPYLYDHENSLTQLITRLFAEAEEREEFDSGEMLQRVVAVQDVLLSLGLNEMADWLKAAERP